VKRSTLLLLGIAVASLTACGCAFTPAPAVLTRKPETMEQAGPRGVKLGLIVRDVRPEFVQKGHLCGTKRNTYMMPTSFVFLAHKEPLDQIVALHLRQTLERAGYEVVGVWPEPPKELSEQTLKEPPGDRKEVDEARKQIRGEKAPGDIKEGGELRVGDEKDDAERKPWTPPAWAKSADAILDVKIETLNCDCLQGIVFVAVQGWCKVKAALCEPNYTERKVVWGKTFSGLGTSGPRPIITDECFAMAVNMAYWMVLGGLEKEIRGEAFPSYVKQAAAREQR